MNEEVGEEGEEDEKRNLVRSNLECETGEGDGKIWECGGGAGRGEEVRGAEERTEEAGEADRGGRRRPHRHLRRGVEGAIGAQGSHVRIASGPPALLVPDLLRADEGSRDSGLRAGKDRKV